MARKGRVDYRTDNKALIQAVSSLLKTDKPGEFVRELEALISERNEKGATPKFLYVLGVDRTSKSDIPWFRRYVTDTPDEGEVAIFLIGYKLIYAPNKPLRTRKAKFIVSVVNEFADVDATRIKTK